MLDVIDTCAKERQGISVFKVLFLTSPTSSQNSVGDLYDVFTGSSLRLLTAAGTAGTNNNNKNKKNKHESNNNNHDNDNDNA